MFSFQTYHKNQRRELKNLKIYLRDVETTKEKINYLVIKSFRSTIENVGGKNSGNSLILISHTFLEN